MATEFCDIDAMYMRRCLSLAALGKGKTAPNPLVGAVIVNEHRIIGEGWHKAYGKPHAEVNAVASVEDKSLLSNSVMYVNLEPCCHWGKTPPCAEMIVKNKIPKVVIANKDANPKVDGGGISFLQKHGVEVVCGVLSEEARHLNRRFFTFMEQKRPYVILKWAQTQDGFMDADRIPPYKPQWISNDILKVWVHKQRAEESAVLVGFRTLINDNPQLNVRYWTGRNPIRISVIKGDIPQQPLHLFDTSQPTIIFSDRFNGMHDGVNYIGIDFSGDIAQQILTALYNLNISSIVIEGGRRTLDMFIEHNLWNEAYVIVGNKSFSSGLPSPVIRKQCETKRFGDNLLMIYNNI
ncbi:MAG: bifunctional diaminohydroxyphosphoribosylaminopyrimidine deaminase/5-amino-6-(5-phosphoribosylamino)uracil reductase RibD [Bacteroidales bacterium]|jgi:diaminohydroxyphosphoribosylaminopyrimidine deaminase/5-amino-6-(5-phosphoribosylamino)uracil reductase|nr:bifunctional diaminohydroxyphosphoribosylaminopyrimidine deaminase/5-amino-6-(5-phosphoribosylamino)uracil reductase RibD [Bacteroidales bacterium]